MTEQEFRLYVKCWQTTFKEYGGRVHYGHEGYIAHITPIDDDVVAIRILRYTDTDEEPASIWTPRPTSVAQDWTIANYQFALELLRWADHGGNWKETSIAEERPI